MHPRLTAFALILAFATPAAAAPPSPQPSSTSNMQGDQQSWIQDPHMHAFYALTVKAFAQGPDRVDTVKFHDDAMAVFRDFAVSRHMPPAAMEDHLKLIPAQVVQIARDDPRVLQSYDAFVAAVFGPP